MAVQGRRVRPLPLSLALQGGGSHGAFAWGVLDVLLARDDIEVTRVSGTSAGAVTAFVLARGLTLGGKREAVRLLAEFWQATSTVQLYLTGGAFQFDLLPFLPATPTLDDNPAYRFADLLGRTVSPYWMPSWFKHPLDPVLAAVPELRGIEEVDLSALLSFRAWVTATDVMTGEAKVFGGSRLRRDTVLASACLPTLTQAVMIDGRPMWDGGFAANPSLAPLLEPESPHDILVVQVNPVDKLAEPKLAHEILNRMNEIGFNASLLWQLKGLERVNDQIALVDALVEAVQALPEEVRAVVIAKARKGIDDYADARATASRGGDLLVPESLSAFLGGDWVTERRPLWRKAVHQIDADGPDDSGIEQFEASSKLNAGRAFLEQLRAMGRAKAEVWCGNDLPKILAQRPDEPASTFRPPETDHA